MNVAGDVADMFAGAKYVKADEVETILRRYHCRHRDKTHLYSIAKTHEGRDVWAIVIGAGPADWAHDRPTVFLNGGHHGDELMATTFALDAVNTLLEEGELARLSPLVFVVIPLVNPDGNVHRFASRLGRKNGRDNDGDGTRGAGEGVDLNRNYPFRWGALGENGSSSNPEHRWFRGPSAGSEPETRGVMRLAASEKFVAAMSFHTGALSLCAPYTIPRVRQPEPDVAWGVGWDIVTRIPPHPEGGVPVQRRLYPLDGNDQDWHRHTHGTLAFLWEGGQDWVSYAPRRFRASARGAWKAMARRFVDGPSYSLRVTGPDGPVVAEVSVKEILHHEGERFTTRCRDGRMDGFFAEPGAYTLVVQSGSERVERRVTVGRERLELSIELGDGALRASSCPPPFPTASGAPGASRSPKR